MTRVIICGSRDFKDKELLYANVNDVLFEEENVKDEIEIVTGGCRGADEIGKQYAIEHGYKHTEFPADWSKCGKKAGYIRNKEMAEYASKTNAICIAFPVGESKGTRMMIRIAHNYGIETNVHYSL